MDSELNYRKVPYLTFIRISEVDRVGRQSLFSHCTKQNGIIVPDGNWCKIRQTFIPPVLNEHHTNENAPR